jgi:hypothetical protein
MMRRFHSLVFVLAPLAALGACSGDDDDAAGPPPASVTPDGGGGPSANDGSAGSDSASGNVDGSDITDAKAQVDTTPAYTPKSLPGLVLWLEGSMGLGTGNKTWADQSGAGNNAKVSTGHQAADRTAALNGHSGLVFDMYKSYEIVDSPSLQWGTEDFLVEAVVHDNWNEIGPSGQVPKQFVWHDDGPSAYIRYSFGEVLSKVPGKTTGAGLSLVYNDWSDYSYKIVGRVDGNNALKIPGRRYEEMPRLLGFRRKGNVLELRVNGTVTSSQTDAGVATNISAAGTNVYIGGRPNFTLFCGAIWEIVAVKGAASDAAVAEFEAYAKAKYALQ